MNKKLISQDLKDKALKAAKSSANILILGDSGVGKEVLAQFIHDNSGKDKYVKVNCAAIHPTLIESELFGHEKGSFTGASNTRVGRFEFANNGNLLLDEITEMPFDLQSKLLRVLQEKEFERVGGNFPIKYDARVISTSNLNIQKAIEDKKFRQDLYYRINVITFFIKQLKYRKEEIIPLANQFLYEFNIEENKEKFFSKKLLKWFLEYDFPGNIRELKNIVERGFVLSEGNEIDIKDIKNESFLISNKKSYLLKDIEKKHIYDVIQLNKTNIETAKMLGISLRTLQNKLKLYKLNKK